MSVRKSGSRLAFVDIRNGLHELQVVLHYPKLAGNSVEEEQFAALLQLLKPGDVVAVKGNPYRTKAGTVSVRVTELPILLAPCLHDFTVVKAVHDSEKPEELSDLDRHVEMLANVDVATMLRVRQSITNGIRSYLSSRGYVEVQTPILEASAGGAMARPFETTASEFPDRVLNLRIAPELWLKRLIIGGMDKVFEIGPSFRNEGTLLFCF